LGGSEFLPNIVVYILHSHMMLQFFKYHGAGNDFIMIDNRDQNFTPTVPLVKWLCDRHFGIGADGLILLETHDQSPFMRYFNCDGNESTMCGNGGRCFAAFAKRIGLTNEPAFNFYGIDGIHTAIYNANGSIKLKMIDVKSIELLDDCYFINTGSPHYVTMVRDVNNVDVEREGRLIRQSVNFNDGGTNVNFIQEVSPGKIKIRTYERGVEAETLACGTGATASAIAYSHYFDINQSPIEVEALGGLLKVYFNQEDEQFVNIWLEGPAEEVFEGKINCPLI